MPSDSITLYRYSDNKYQWQFSVDISGYTAYSQIRKKDGTLAGAFTCTIVDTYYLELKILEAAMADIPVGNYLADVKLKDTSSGFEHIEFELAVEVKDAQTQTPV